MRWFNVGTMENMRGFRRFVCLSIIVAIGIFTEDHQASASIVLSSAATTEGINLSVQTYYDSSFVNVASQFTTGPGNWQVNSATISVGLTTGTSAAPGYGLIIATDSDPTAPYSFPGSTVGSFNITGNQVIAPVTEEIYYPTSSLILNGNTTYWLEMYTLGSPGGPGYVWYGAGLTTENDGWSFGVGTSDDLPNQGTPNQTLSGVSEPREFIIDADTTSVPEPATTGMLGIASLLVLARRSRKVQCGNRDDCHSV